jgi:predicted metallopeptidase
VVSQAEDKLKNRINELVHVPPTPAGGHSPSGFRKPTGRGCWKSDEMVWCSWLWCKRNICGARDTASQS